MTEKAEHCADCLMAFPEDNFDAICESLLSGGAKSIKSDSFTLVRNSEKVKPTDRGYTFTFTSQAVSEYFMDRYSHNPYQKT